MLRPSRSFLVVVVSLSASIPACRNHDESEVIQPPRNGAPVAKSPDRLPPGELLEGPDKIFGFPIPRGMKLDAQFPGRAHVVGRVEQGLVTNYVRQRVLVHHVQVEGRRYIFPKVRIRGGGEEIYRFEVSSEPGRTRIYIEELRAPAPIQGLTEEQRWKAAGMRPDGSLIDPQNLE